jgi:hypothetical protein
MEILWRFMKYEWIESQAYRKYSQELWNKIYN